MYRLLSRPKDGNPVLGARFSPEDRAALRAHAARHDRTISDIIREGVRAVIQPSNALPGERPQFPATPMRPRTLPPGQGTIRQALSNSLAEQARLAAADAAVSDRRPRDGRAADAAGMLTDQAVRGALARR
jgi:hypothetical protein